MATVFERHVLTYALQLAEKMPMRAQREENGQLAVLKSAVAEQAEAIDVFLLQRDQLVTERTAVTDRVSSIRRSIAEHEENLRNAIAKQELEVVGSICIDDEVR